MAETQKLILELKAEIAKYNRDVLDATAKTTKFQKKSSQAFDRVRKDSKKAGDSLFKFSTVAKSVFAALSFRAFTNFADEIQIANNQLKNVTSTTEQFNLVSIELNRIAVETRQNVSGLTSVFARFSRAGQDAGFTFREVLDLTESLTKALKIEGNTTAEVNSVLLQLTQSFRSGVIAGEEFKAVSEGSTLVLRALAKQMGVNIGDLKKLASENLVTPRALIEGLKKLSPEIRKQFKTLEPTFAEVGASLGNVFAAAYNDSVLQQTADNFKTFIISTSKDLQRFFSGEENQSLATLNDQIETTKKRIIELRGIQERSGLDYGSQLLRNTRLLVELEERVISLTNSQKESSLDITINDVQEDPRIQAEKDFIEIVNELKMGNIETAQEILDFEVAIHQAALETKLINERKFNELQALSTEKFGKNKDQESKFDKKRQRENLKNQKGFLSAGAILANTFFEDNKLIQAGFIVAETAAGIQRQFADTTFDAAIGQAAVVAATGVAQLASLRSAGKGGGSISGGPGGSGGGGAAGSTFSPDAVEDPEETITSVSDITGGSITTVRLVLTTEDGNTFIDTLGTQINESISDGRID